MAPRFGVVQLVLAALGTAAAVLDVLVDGWVAAEYAWGGQPGLAALVLALLAAASLATQACSWLWYRSDPPALHPDAVAPGHPSKYPHLGPSEEEQSHIAFLSHDISMLRLFETFLENTPQLTLLLYVILRTNKAEAVLSCCFFPISWSLRSFLQHKYELSWRSSIIYFLWNLFLICPRILVVALFALLWPYAVAVHFPLVWLAMFLWVTLQGTDFMESSGSEQLYRAMVAVILYFSWFNVAQGRTLYRSIIYHGFILVDSTLLALSWLWCRFPSDESSYLIPLLSAALPCYLLGLALRVTYYKWLHPNMRVLCRRCCSGRWVLMGKSLFPPWQGLSPVSACSQDSSPSPVLLLRPEAACYRPT
uniref:XK-related protein n=1 Tax=Calidris pygmaea TaxID=425635 RepID=A0A8C3J3D0_9CHAR